MNPAVSSLALPPTLDIEGLLASLPAQIRASVAWAAKPIRAGLAELRGSQPDIERLARIADEVMQPVVSLNHAAIRALREESENFERAASIELERERIRLGDFIDDDESRDTVDWAFELLHRLYASIPPVPRELFDVEIDIEELRATFSVVAFIRGLTALMAASEEARLGSNRTIAADLVDLAFIELGKMAELLASEGLTLEPFAEEPREQRLQRFARNVEWLRLGLTETEHATLVGAQLRDFDDASRH